MTHRPLVWAALAAALLFGLALRMYHVNDPILDHPGWRQGDEACIARNFAQLENNIFRPQTDYDGPPPNYVELELQIVPYLAAQAYRAFGVHEVFGRLIAIAFSLGLIAVMFFFATDVFGPRAGVVAAVLTAITPGAVYYGRTFTPDSVMLFFATLTLWLWWRWCDRSGEPYFWLAVATGALAWLAKSPALLCMAPILALVVARRGWRGFLDWHPWAFVALTLAPFLAYFAYEGSIAEWHWASGITSKHVLPALSAELRDPRLFAQALGGLFDRSLMLSTTILGPALFGFMLLGGFALSRGDAHDVARRWLFGAWAAALVAYAFVVVNVERVDYYLILFVPFAVLLATGLIDTVWSVGPTKLVPHPAGARIWKCTAITALTFIIAWTNMAELAPYYKWSRPVYAAATELDKTLEPGALVVMGHYDPSVLYLIGRKGWEEDVSLWDVHDMTSAIGKGAVYFVAIEIARFKNNKPLYAFMQKYRRVPVRSGWQVYDMRHFAHPNISTPPPQR